MTISNKFSKILRKNSTEPEKILWHYLRNRRFLGYKFRRQFTLGKYIVDFICLEKKLVIELDGSEHLKPDELEYDKIRTEYLNKRGLQVIRFYNSDIFNNIDNVLEHLRENLVTPSSGFQPPSPIKGEGSDKNTLNPTPKGEGACIGDQGQNIFTPTPKGEGACIGDQEQNIFTPTPKGEGMESKSQLRKWARGKRSELDMKSLSSILAQKLQQTEEYKQAKNIMIFYPLKDEVDLLSLIEDKTKTFYLPKIDGENLLCCKFDEDVTLCESCFHTKEPAETKIFTPDLVIVPALACDKNNYRLGYGKGFYDRFLGVHKNIKTIVCIPKELIVETVFPNEYDIPVDLVITD